MAQYKTDYGCCICNHKNRTDIESALLAGQAPATIAKHYEVPEGALENHRQNCSVYLMSLDEFDLQVAEELEALNHPGATALKKPGSIQRQLGLKEADLLANMAQEYMVTLKNLGRKLNRIISILDTPEGAVMGQRVLRKPVCDMYVQMGGEIRQAVRTMAEIDKMINGPEENPLTGLQALATAIHTSAALASETQN